MDKNKFDNITNAIEHNIIDETYNGINYPIIEREYNAYYFPENYNPDNMEDQSKSIENCFKEHCKVKVWKNIKTK
ncbi:hypothetical protein [Lutispora thermophila]|uniref:Uncharacterized protein n=1 Tax=Lutispora thermophila DSM 19022 TaxID=1122184 RepID=A0A1M6AYA0_9FIRM|nr:hypothetical protein [Lutispora thermophila]SHI41489.1 hypothetical protein SAMN02745176_00181 [Lutispora thermophila DSM 19022]